MKRILIVGAFSLLVGGPALAADLPPPPGPMPRAPATYVPAPIPYYNWTGFYIGGNLGWGWNQGGFNGPVAITTTNTSSFLGGAQVGYNYQFGGSGVVLGAEADFDWLANSNNTTNTTGAGFNVTSNGRWVTLLDARLGYAIDRFLVYGKGGFAWLGSDSFCVSGGVGCFANNSNYGWNAGVGVEWAFYNNLSARLEYDYVGINSTSVGVPASGLFPGGTFTGSGRSFQMINLGLNYKFGW